MRYNTKVLSGSQQDHFKVKKIGNSLHTTLHVSTHQRRNCNNTTNKTLSSILILFYRLQCPLAKTV